MIFDLMFFDANCFDTNKMIDTKDDDLLIMSSQTFHDTSNSFDNEFVNFIEFDDVFAQLFSIQFIQISKSIRSFKSWIYFVRFIFCDDSRFLFVDDFSCLSHQIADLLSHENNVLCLTWRRFLRIRTELFNNKKLKFLSTIEKSLTMYCDSWRELLFFCAFSTDIVFRCCWVQLCFCFKWSIMILSFRQTYWHCVNFNWHCNSSMCNFNAEMTALIRLSNFNSIEYWSTSNHDWIAVCKFFARCLLHLWWDSW